MISDEELTTSICHVQKSTSRIHIPYQLRIMSKKKMDTSEHESNGNSPLDVSIAELLKLAILVGPKTSLAVVSRWKG